MEQKFNGRCLCGRVSYVASGAPVIVAQCHCEQCRRISGTGHSVGAMFASTTVTLSGAIKTHRYTSANGSRVTKAFCGRCGSPVYGTNSRTPDHMTLTLGTMDDATGLSVKVVIFGRDKPHWDDLGADVACFQTQPDWSP